MFNDYKIVVTGATSGIGLAIAKKFIEEGATVIAIGRDFEKVGDLGERYIPCRCDVSCPADIEKACAFIGETFHGELDTFVNNAGGGCNISVTDVTAEVFDYGMHLLLQAPMLFGKYLYPMLLKALQKNPSIVNIASAASRCILPDNMVYNMAKAAHVLLNKQQAAGYTGVRCNSISPGFVDTPIFERPGSDLDHEQVLAMYGKVSQLVPCGRIAQPEEIAELAAFLASEDAMYINSADVLIDGGLSTVTP